jgi:hypothetical protein
MTWGISLTIVRTLDAYSIHGHLSPGSEDESLLDYVEFFSELAATDVHQARFPVGGDTVAMTETTSRGDRVAFRLVSGNAEELPLVYDLRTGTAEEVDPGRDRFVVSGAWVIVDPIQRILVLERKRPGVPVFQIERFLGQFGKRLLNLSYLTVTLNPVPSSSFAQEISTFTRIREASITLRRPNHSWTQSASSMLGELSNSNAAEIQLQLNADRGQSLSKSEGVVAEVLDLARNPIGPLKNAVVKGTRPDFEGERSVSLRKHTVKGTARVDPKSGPFAQLESLEKAAIRMIQTAAGLPSQILAQVRKGPDVVAPPAQLELSAGDD